MSPEALFLSYMEVGFYSVAAGFALLVLWLLLTPLRASRSLCSLLMAGLVLRLLLPVSIASPWSAFRLELLDSHVIKAEDFSRSFSGDYKIALDIPGGGNDFRRAVEAGVPALEPEQWSREPESFPYRAAFYYEDGQGGITPAKTQRETLVPILARVWLGGCALLLLYTLLSWMHLRRRLAFAVREEDHWLSDRIQSPCVVGLLRPRIYLPFGLSPQEKRIILCHERQHIRRGDQILKALSWLALCLHWYHAWLWIYHTWFSALLEEACDERTLAVLGGNEKEAYARTLLAVASGRRFAPPPTPVSFCENDTRSRVKAVLRYKKPRLLTTVLALALILCAAVSLLTVPAGGDSSRPPAAVPSGPTNLTR